MIKIYTNGKLVSVTSALEADMIQNLAIDATLNMLDKLSN